MLNRRSWLAQLKNVAFAAPALALVSSVVTEAKAEQIPDKFTYRGYCIKWTGWKSNPESSDFYGQWVAWPVNFDGKGYFAGCYSNTGGIVDSFRRGDVFNIANLKPEYWINEKNIETDGPRVRKETLNRLIKYMLEHGV